MAPLACMFMCPSASAVHSRMCCRRWAVGLEKGACVQDTCCSSCAVPFGIAWFCDVRGRLG